MSFSIFIVHQYWTDDTGETDLCSHGKLGLNIGGVTIEAGDEAYGISESALAMLRTISENHLPSNPVAERMIFHGCGSILMQGCPIGIDWSVEHTGSTVRIFDVVKYPTTNESEAIRYPGVDVSLPLEDYANQVVRFATKAKSIFGPKEYFDDFCRSMHTDYMNEFDERYRSASELVA